MLQIHSQESERERQSTSSFLLTKAKDSYCKIDNLGDSQISNRDSSTKKRNVSFNVLSNFPKSNLKELDMPTTRETLSKKIMAFSKGNHTQGETAPVSLNSSIDHKFRLSNNTIHGNQN